MTEAIIPFIQIEALVVDTPLVYLNVLLSLVFLGSCFVVFRYVDESSVIEDSRRSEDTESTLSNHSSEIPGLPDQAAGQTGLLWLLRSRQILFFLVVFTLPAFVEIALQASTTYLWVTRPSDQDRQQVPLSLLPGGIIRFLLFVFIVPRAISFVQKRFGISNPGVDIWIIRGSLLSLAISGALITSVSTFASRMIGE